MTPLDLPELSLIVLNPPPLSLPKIASSYGIQRHTTWCKTFFLWCSSPTWARAASFVRFRDHTQWQTTVGRTPLDEGSAHRWDLHLPTHTTLTTDWHSCPQRDFFMFLFLRSVLYPYIHATGGIRTRNPSKRSATGINHGVLIINRFCFSFVIIRKKKTWLTQTLLSKSKIQYFNYDLPSSDDNKTKLWKCKEQNFMIHWGGYSTWCILRQNSHICGGETVLYHCQTAFVKY